MLAVPMADHSSHDTVALRHPHEVHSPTLSNSSPEPYHDLESHCEYSPGEATWRVLLVKQLKLMGPIVFTYMLDYIPSLVGVILVGHLDSPDTELFVNAVTMSSMFTTLSSLSVCYGLCSALDTLSSQAYGAGQHKKIGVYLQTAFIVVFGGCLVPVFLLNWHVESFLLLAGQDTQVAKLAGEFSRYTVWGTPFLFFYEMLCKLLQAQNVVRPLVWIGAVGNVFEIGSGYYLCYHTTLGFHGAALARLVGSIVLPLVLSVYLGITRDYKSWWAGWDFGAAKKQVRVFLHLGIPGLLMLAMEWWAYEILTVMAGVLPNPILSVTAHTVLLHVASSVYKVHQGIASSGKILVGNALGANQPKQAQFTTKLTFSLVLTLASLFALLIYVLRFQIPMLITNDTEAIHRAGQALLVLLPYCTMDAMYCAMLGIYCGMGRQKLSAATNAIAYYAIGTPLSALLAFYFHVGVEGLWAGLGTGSLVAFTICAVVLYRTDWQQMATEAQQRTAQ